MPNSTLTGLFTDCAKVSSGVRRVKGARDRGPRLIPAEFQLLSLGPQRWDLGAWGCIGSSMAEIGGTSGST